MPDFLSLERHNNSPEIVAPKEVMNLIPTVPSTNVDYVQGKMTLNRENYLKDMLNRGNSESAAPLYEYKTAQEERYSNPYMQFTPQIQGSYSSEDAYGKNQGPLDQLYNGVVKMGATAGSAFLSGFTSIPNQIDALRQGRVSDALFASDSAFSETQRWMEELENKFPNYMTQVEQDRSWIVNAFTPTGAANFWGDTILKNSGFTIGAIANAVVVDSALELLSAGAATPATLILAGKQISNALTPLKNAYRALAKASSLGKVDDLMGVAKAGEGLIKGLEVTNKAFGFKKASQLLATTYMSAQGEAMIEGYHTYVDTKTKLLEDAVNKGKELTPEYLRGIEDTASSAGKVTAMMNTAILSVSNLVQFPKILGWTGGSDILEKVSGKYLGIQVGEQGLIATNNWTKKAGVRQVLKDTILKGFVSEGAEEGSQYYIGNTLHDYYIDKFNGKAKKDMLGYMTDAIPKTLQDGDFWKESLIGGLSGMITGSVIPGGEIQNSIKTNLYGKHSQYAEHLQRGLDQFNQGVASMVDLDENLSLEGVDKRQASYKSLNRAVQTAAKFGSLDTLKESLNDLREIPLDEYNKMFLSEPLKSERDKIDHINRVADEIDRIERDTKEVAKTYKNNPFATSKMKEFIKAKFNVDDKMVLGIQEKMFEDWKENQSYLIGRIRNTRKTSENLRDELRLGSNTQSLEEFNILHATITGISEDALPTYLTHKNNQIQALKIEEEYYKDLKNPMKQKEVREELNRLTRFYNALDIASKGKDKELIKELILSEEFSFSQQERITKMFEESKKEEEILDNSEKELVKATDDTEGAAKDQVEVVKELIDQENAENPQVTDVEDSLEMNHPHYDNLRTMNKGTKINYNGQILTLGDTTKTNISTEEGVVFTPKGVVIGGQLTPYSGQLSKVDTSKVDTSNKSKADKVADIEKRRQEELKQVNSLSFTEEEIKKKQQEQQKRLNNANEVVSFGKTFSEALDNLIQRQQELNDTLNKRQKEDTKDRIVHQWTKEELESQPEWKKIKRLDKLIDSINNVYTEGKQENFNNSTQEAVDFEKQELDSIPNRKKRNTSEIIKINADFNAELKALEENSEQDKSESKPSSKPLFDEMKKDKELTTKPNHIEGRYILKGSRYSKGFTYYILKSNGFQTVNVDENGNESFGKIVKFNREETFYSVDGEIVKEEAPIVDDSIVEPVLEKEENIEEKQGESQEQSQEEREIFLDSFLESVDYNGNNLEIIINDYEGNKYDVIEALKNASEIDNNKDDFGSILQALKSRDSDDLTLGEKRRITKYDTELKKLEKPSSDKLSEVNKKDTQEQSQEEKIAEIERMRTEELENQVNIQAQDQRLSVGFSEEGGKVYLSTLFNGDSSTMSSAQMAKTFKKEVELTVEEKKELLNINNRVDNMTRKEAQEKKIKLLDKVVNRYGLQNELKTGSELKSNSINAKYDAMLNALKGENLTQEEKIKSFISTVSNDSLRAVLLTSIDRNLIEVTC